MELGGFASGLRFSGDAEFLRRAQYVAKVLNIPDHCYFRRIRQGSLTTAQRDRTEVAGAPARDGDAVGARPAKRRAGRDRRAARPDPLRDRAARRPAPPGRACRCGAPATPRRHARRAARPRTSQWRPRPAAGRPGRSSSSARTARVRVRWPGRWVSTRSIPAVMDTAWVTELARDLPQIHDSRDHPARGAPRPIGRERFSRTFGRAAAALMGDRLERWVDCAPEHTTERRFAGQAVPRGTFHPRGARRGRCSALARRPSARLRRGDRRDPDPGASPSTPHRSPGG